MRSASVRGREERGCAPSPGVLEGRCVVGGWWGCGGHARPVDVSLAPLLPTQVETLPLPSHPYGRPPGRLWCIVAGAPFCSDRGVSAARRFSAKRFGALRLSFCRYPLKAHAGGVGGGSRRPGADPRGCDRGRPRPCEPPASGHRRHPHPIPPPPGTEASRVEITRVGDRKTLASCNYSTESDRNMTVRQVTHDAGPFGLSSVHIGPLAPHQA